MSAGNAVPLPRPQTLGGLALHTALMGRESVRAYTNDPLTLGQVSQLLWAAQGETHSRRGHPYRTAPSGGAFFPIDTHLLADRVDGLEPGVYRYRPGGHDLVKAADGARAGELPGMCARQDWMASAPLTFVFGASVAGAMKKYGERAKQYALIEVGHIGQNILLEAVSLDLGAAVIGAFKESRLHRLAALPDGSHPVYVISVGVPG